MNDRHLVLRTVRSIAACAIVASLWARSADAEPGARPWQENVLPTVQEAADRFANPPAEYGLIMWWYWNGDMTEANIRRDLAELKSRGVRSVMIWPYHGLVGLEYLSPAWFERVKYAVHEARRLDLRVWLMDEGCYPSGFAGGKVTRERPWQRMQVLAAQDAADGQVQVKPQFRTSATRYIHSPGFKKDAAYSLFDSLDPAATRDFLEDVHQQYWKCFGEEFGRTVLGFMGDEPSFPGVPYTAGIFEDFERLKGYDIRPHLPKLFMKAPTEQAQRIRADYWDVWTDRYRDSFFKPQADWCARHGVELLMHVCGEEDMQTLLSRNGDYFKCMQPVQAPGVDAIWRQIWPDKTADYAKLASSAAHLSGRPRAFSEAYAVYGCGLTVEQAKWVLDHHLARGINLFQAMSYLSSSETFRPYFCPPDLNNSPQWPHFSQLFAYANRMSYLLSVGRPAAAIAVYYPTTSGWLDDFSANTAALQIAQCLLEHQRDFDFVAEENLQSGLKLEAGAMTNQSGQQYRAVIIPPVKVISWKSLERLEEFAKQGGAVIVVGKLPELVAGRTYRDAAKGPTSLPWAKLATLADLEPVPEPSLPHARRGSPDPAAPADRRSPATIRDWLSSTPAPPPLPKPDLALEQASRGTTCPAVKYVHRRLADGEIYFLFNESARVLDLSVLLEGGGEPQYWDAVTGERRRPAAWRRDAGYVRLPLTLEPYQTRTIVLGPASSAPKDVQPALKETGESLVIEGDWTLAIAGRRLKGPLKSWSEYGEPSCSGSARYSKQFTLPQSLTDRKRVLYLDLGEVRYSARVVLNGKDLGALAWRPFRYAVGDAIRPGLNTIEIEITNTAANELAGDPERLAELERKGWLQNSYINRYLPFDKEMTPSGLLGPVRLAAYEAAK